MDDNQAEAVQRRAAAMAIGNYLQDTIRLDRQIRSLKMSELEAIAAAAVAGWTCARAERMAAGHDDQDLMITL